MTVSGGIGGAAFWLAVYPIDSVKSRIQVLSMARQQEGFLLSFLHILRTEGESCGAALGAGSGGTSAPPPGLTCCRLPLSQGLWLFTAD